MSSRSWTSRTMCALQNFDTEDDVAKGAFDQEFVVEK